MNNKLSALLTTAIVSGLLATQVAKAEEASTQNTGDQVTAEKNSCKGQSASDKNSCKGQKDMKKKKKDKNSCKNGCGEAKHKKTETKEEEK